MGNITFNNFDNYRRKESLIWKLKHWMYWIKEKEHCIATAVMIFTKNKMKLQRCPHFSISCIVNGYDENGECYFKTEYQMFEVGTGGFNGNKSNSHLTRIAEPNSTSIPESVLQFPTFVPKDGYKVEMSDSDEEISSYSPLFPRQHYSSQYDFIPHPMAHGRYTFAGAIKLILCKYADGNVEKFKAAKVRESEQEIIRNDL